MCMPTCCGWELGPALLSFLKLLTVDVRMFWWLDPRPHTKCFSCGVRAGGTHWWSLASTPPRGSEMSLSRALGSLVVVLLSRARPRHVARLAAAGGRSGRRSRPCGGSPRHLLDSHEPERQGSQRDRRAQSDAPGLVPLGRSRERGESLRAEVEERQVGGVEEDRVHVLAVGCGELKELRVGRVDRGPHSLLRKLVQKYGVDAPGGPLVCGRRA